MSFRLILQPAVAAFFAVRAGWQDGLAGHPVYFWDILKPHSQGRALMREAWKDVAKVFAMAIIVDAVYQAIQLRWFYPGEALLVAIVLAFVPYLLIRGPVGRVVRSWRSMRVR
jgi:hypothetical protein